MYDIRQFKPALYLLLLLGISGFALAGESPWLWILGTAGILLNAGLVRTGRFAPMPRVLANLITVAALLYVLREVFTSGVTPVLVIGQFLVLLQLVKLYEQRGNRDYAQLLVLGLLLMVAASINTTSLLFGLLLIVYLFLSLYCCLLFHLKVEADTAKAALAIAEDKLSPATLRQDQRYLSRSMRRLTGFIASFAIFFAVVVFLFFPRGSGGGILGPLQFRAAQPLVGFSDQVGFQQVARIQQNDEVVAYVQLWKNDRLVNGTKTLLLRGITLDHYDREAPSGSRPSWEWVRSPADVTMLRVPDRDTVTWSNEIGGAPRGAITTDRWRQKITLRPTGTSVLFALAGPVSLTPRRAIRIQVAKYDGVVESVDPITEALEYEVISRDSLDPTPDAQAPPVTPSESDPLIRQYAERPEVSGSNAKGPLGAQRSSLAIDPLDGEIARRIETHLRTTFKYTLDLTDTKQIEGRDPLVAFLYDWKKGHCEYFAGAMTRLCQSLGMQARMVVGFKCDEYNNFSNNYIVRQSHAHAWVEVHTPDGWQTFDPTSGTDADAATRRTGLWQQIRHALDYLEYTYANHVIAYDNEDRNNLIQATERRMSGLAIRSRGGVGGIQEWLHSVLFWKVSSTLLGGFFYLMVLVLIGALVAFFWEKWRLRRRAARMGINSLPASEQIRLARQLGFYDDLVLLLGRHRITRPRHLTPLEFANSLLYLPSDVYHTVRRLTQLFYRVRFGRAELDAAQRRRLDTVLARLGEELSRGGAAQ